MNYWKGYMDWPINPAWKCETCGEYHGLEWGLIHAQCRCNQCHAQYTMLANNEEHTVLTVPHSLHKEEYKAPAKRAWQKYHIPEDELSDEQWEECGAPLEAKR